jgi:Protein of unknown function (DUF2752)
VTETNRPGQPRLSGRDRILAAVLAIGLTVPLAIAAVLRPNPSGYGTHQQLGLPPCTFVVLFGRRCPSCGMTTAWAHLVRGEVADAFRANAGGALLGLLALLAEPWLLIAAVRGRWLGWVPRANVLGWVLAGVVVVTLIDWSIRMLGG